MSEQNPTEKGKKPTPISATAAKDAETVEALVVRARCPQCGRVLPGMNILTMELPTPQGGMVWLLPSCPFVAGPEGKAADGGEACGKVIGVQFMGYNAPKIARPGWPT